MKITTLEFFKRVNPVMEMDRKSRDKAVGLLQEKAAAEDAKNGKGPEATT